MNRKMKYALTLIVSTALSGFALPVLAQQSSGTGNTSISGTANTSQNAGTGSAAKFLKHAQISSEFEQQAAMLGTQRAQNQQLKQFAEQIVQQHSQNQQQLQSLAQSQGLSQNEPLPQRLTQQLAKLDRESGQSFDRSLATCLLRANAQSLKRSQRAEEQIQNPQVRQFAQTPQQEQQQHLQQAAQVARAVGVSQNTITAYQNEANQANQGMGGSSESQNETSGSGSSQK